MKQKRVSQRTANRLKDEVYRQMLRLEGDRSAARLLLVLALLKAWMALEEQPPDCEPRQWLRRICPFCVSLIEDARKLATDE
jgi:DNA-directed RNA polymerase specialized sigma24 family protein